MATKLFSRKKKEGNGSITPSSEKPQVTDFSNRFRKGNIDFSEPFKDSHDLLEKLNLLYAQLRFENPLKRQEALKEALRTSVQSLSPDKGRLVLSEIRNFIGTPESPSDKNLEEEKKGESLPSEKLFQAGFKGIRNLSQHFVGDKSFDTASQLETFIERIRTTLESTLNGISLAQKGQQEFQKQFDIDMNQLLHRPNSTMNQIQDPKKLARRLLDWDAPLEGQKSQKDVDRSLQDLSRHPLALLTGMQEALKEIFDRLDPQGIEKEVLSKAQGKVSGVMAKMGLPRLAWQRYTEVFKDSFEEKSKLFHQIIAPQIQKGYLKTQVGEKEPGGK